MKKLIVSMALASAACAPLVAKADEDRINLWPLVGYNDGALDVLWPLGHFKDSNEWRFFPVVQDNGLFCVFPEFWFGRNEFAVLPLVAANDFSAGTLFPVWWWNFGKKDTLHTLFPAYYYCGRDNKTTFWAGCGLAGCHSDGRETSHWLIPLYVWTKDVFLSIPYSYVDHEVSQTHGFLCGLGGFSQKTSGEMIDSWCLPFWHKDDHSVFTPAYACKWDHKGEIMSWVSPLLLSGGWQDHTTWKERYLLGLAGGAETADSGFCESWCAPFYYANNRGTLVTPVYGQVEDALWGLPGWYSDDDTFASPVWYSHRDDKGSLDQWMIPVLLSGGVYRDGLRKNGFLFNAAGMMSGDDGYFASWCMPLYFKDNRDTFITPLYGYNKSSQWCFPLWYSDEKALFSALWCQEKDEEGQLKHWMAPLLLSGGSTKADGSREAKILLGLGGATWGGEDGSRSSWAFPFYYENSRGFLVTPLFGYERALESHWVAPLYYTDRDGFVSLPYGSLAKGSHTNTWWATPLVGTRSGSMTGGWLFPLFNREKDADFDQSLARLDSPTIPSDTTFRDEVHCFTNRAGEVSTWTNCVASRPVSARISGSLLLASDHDRSVRGSVVGSRDRGRYLLTESVKHGNRLFFNRASSRTVSFDLKTRRRKGETFDSEVMALCGLFYHEHQADSERNTSHTRTRVLWKFWDREEKNGDVSVDAFPGFTHDSKKNGYTKTSFLWRFFRYEEDPADGSTKLDLLYLPILR